MLLPSFYNGYYIKAPSNPNSEFPYEVTYKVRGHAREGVCAHGNAWRRHACLGGPRSSVCHCDCTCAQQGLDGRAGPTHKRAGQVLFPLDHHTPTPSHSRPHRHTLLATRRPQRQQNTKGEWVGEPSASFWLFRTPDGLRKTLVWLDKRYSVDGRKVEFTISENGVSGPNEQSLKPPAVLQDNYRLRYYS